MTFEESEYLNLMTLARKFDSCKQEIRETVLKLRQAGYKIEIIEWGEQRKWKVNYHQFRAALLHERNYKPIER